MKYKPAEMRFINTIKGSDHWPFAAFSSELQFGLTLNANPEKSQPAPQQKSRSLLIGR
jgi:hypothetical protein